MSASGLPVFDKTLQTTHIWLNEIMDDIGPNRQVAWRVLSVVLHKLRDRMPLSLAVHLGASLPLLVRGVYCDQFEPKILPTECDSPEEFEAEVAEWLSDTRPVNPQLAMRSVFGVLSRHMPPGLLNKVRDSLPARLRDWWEQLEDEAWAPRQRQEPPPSWRGMRV